MNPNAPISFTPINNIDQGQVSQAQNVYNANQAGTQSAAQGVQQYQQQLARPENQLGNIYGQNVSSTEQQMGLNPADILRANQALANTNTVMANLPAAVQQAANGRMVTGAQEANRYAQQANNLQGVIAGQSNAAQALQSGLSNALNQAGQQTQFTGQSQQMQLGALENVYQNAADQYKTAQSQLQNLQQLYLNQGEFNANEVAQYRIANAQMVQAQAAMASAGAAMEQAQTARMIANAQLSGLNQGNQSNQAAIRAGMPNLTGYQSPGTGTMQDIEAFLQSLVHLNPTANFTQLGQNAGSLLQQLGV